MMKKLVLVSGVALSLLLGVFNFSLVGAQNKPMTIQWSAVNMSTNNSNAVTTGARPGDSLRYEVTLSGGAGPGNYNPRIDVSDLLNKAEMINYGAGKLEGDELVYPSKLCAGCEEQKFNFYVRVKDVCGSANSTVVSFNNVKITVPIECELAQTGPNLLVFMSVGLIIMIMGYFILSLKRDKIN